MINPPATAGGTDPSQAEYLYFEGKAGSRPARPPRGNSFTSLSPLGVCPLTYTLDRDIIENGPWPHSESVVLDCFPTPVRVR